MSVLGPIVDRLRYTHCQWWTIELADPADAQFTHALLLEHLAAEEPPSGYDTDSKNA